MAGLVKFDVLPETGSSLVSSSIKLPGGTSAGLTEKAVSRVETALLEIKDSDQIKNRMTVVGSTVSDDPETGQHCGGIQVLLDAADRSGTTTKEFLLQWEEASGVMTDAESVVFEARTEGPPGDPVELWLRGHDPGDLKKAAREIIDELRKMDGVHQIRSDVTSVVDELHLTLKPEARFLGLSQDELARQVRAAFYGREAVRLQRGRDDLRIKVRYTQAERKNPATLENLHITTGEGYKVPLLSVAEINYAKGDEAITRVDGLPCVAVSAAVDVDKANPEEIVDELSGGILIELSEKYPGLGYLFRGGGETHAGCSWRAYYRLPAGHFRYLFRCGQPFPFICPAIYHSHYSALRHYRRNTRSSRPGL